MTACICDLPDPIRLPLLRLQGLRRRFYVAWCLGYPIAVLGNKDRFGLTEWQNRDWTAQFAGQKPQITDVTDSVPDLFRAIFADNLPPLTGDPVSLQAPLPSVPPGARQLVFVPPATVTYRTSGLQPGDYDLSMTEPDFWNMVSEVLQGMNRPPIQDAGPAVTGST